MDVSVFIIFIFSKHSPALSGVLHHRVIYSRYSRKAGSRFARTHTHTHIGVAEAEAEAASRARVYTN